MQIYDKATGRTATTAVLAKQIGVSDDRLREYATARLRKTAHVPAGNGRHYTIYEADDFLSHTANIRAFAETRLAESRAKMLQVLPRARAKALTNRKKHADARAKQCASAGVTYESRDVRLARIERKLDRLMTELGVKDDASPTAEQVNGADAH